MNFTRLVSTGGGQAAMARLGTGAVASREAGGMAMTFPGLLAQASRRAPSSAGDGTGVRPMEPAPMSPDEARKSAEEFVSIALVQPVLAQLRKTNQAWGPFGPGAHEEQFGPLMDAEIGVRMTRASSFPLVDAVTRVLLRKQDDGGAATDDTKQSPASEPA